MRIQFIKIVYCLISTSILSCSQSPIADGGPCKYSSTYYPAKVIAIDTIDINYFDLQFEVNQQGYLDTLIYSLFNHSEFISSKDLETTKCTVGVIYKFEHKHLTVGSCTPDIFRLEMERWEE